MRIAVTGASGFIGRHVLNELAGHAIESVAVILPSVDRNSVPPCADVVSMDILDPPADAFALMGHPDALIHLAWSGLPNYRSLHHFERELPAHYRFLKSLVESGLSNLLVVGTCFEYGMQSGSLSEDMESRPSNPYGFAKDALRRELEHLRAVLPFALVWPRLFYLYGEGQSKSSLYPQLVEAVNRGEAAFDMSGGEQLRDYLPVEEV
ncbi:MAG: NAD-dependent epimerase/dehydratase family protein, partial [Solirubrobacterales bacterium]